MVRGKGRWKFLILNLILLNAFTECLPIDTSTPYITTTETAFISTNGVTNIAEDMKIDDDRKSDETNKTNVSRDSVSRNVRPGQEVNLYSVSITFNGNDFTGRAVIDVMINEDTMEDGLVFNFDGVEVQSVATGVFTEASALPAEFNLADGVLEVFPIQVAATYIVIVEYTGTLATNGHGLHSSGENEHSYVAMNLHPTHARRVFPCMDEPTATSRINFRFSNVDFTNVITNALLDAANSNEEVNQFLTLQSPPHLWGMVAHNFINLNIPTTNVVLTGRAGVPNQDSQASIAINAYFGFLNEWTNKQYFEIILNQDSRMHVTAFPDVDRNWNALTLVGLWEPYVLMEINASVKQRKTVLTKIAEAMARQWFGYVIYPQNWKHEWVISGLVTYAAYEAMGDFQAPAAVEDITLLDVETLFITEVMHESLLRDAYIGAQVLEPEEDMFEEDIIRDHIYGLLKYKAPALLRMTSWILGDGELNLIRESASALLNGRALQTVSTQNFIDSVNSHLLMHNNYFIFDIGLFLEPWLRTNGYPMIHIGLRQGGVLITQERFSFTSQPHVNFEVPLSFTTSVAPNFDPAPPLQMMDATTTLNMVLDEEDWVLFNIRGQGYYRVNYDGDLWERIIGALSDPERRAIIHPLNRATLVDDALNLARAGRIDYDIAFRVVLTMEHETEYAVWKAFVRNMDFLRKRLVAYVEAEELDPDIYLRMVRRTIGSVEEELGFQPDPLLAEPAMRSLTRGLVMDHACRSNYEPCIAAAVDLFYDPNNNEVVNPSIPHDIRPAVYCTMVREGNGAVINALNDRLEIEASMYERVVILESLACSRDDEFIRGLLEETLTPGNRFSIEERVRIFKAVAESSVSNAWVAVNFMSRRTADIRDMYGGDQKLEELILVLAENMVDWGLANDFTIWVNAQNNNLDGSQELASRTLEQINENLEWDNDFKEYVYEWIDLNDAPTLAVSLILVSITFIITLFN